MIMCVSLHAWHCRQVELDDVEILLAVDEADHTPHAQPSTLVDELGAAISEGEPLLSSVWVLQGCLAGKLYSQQATVVFGPQRRKKCQQRVARGGWTPSGRRCCRRWPT